MVVQSLIYRYNAQLSYSQPCPQETGHCTYICDIDQQKQDCDKCLSRNGRFGKILLWTIDLAQNLLIRYQIDAEGFIQGFKLNDSHKMAVHTH